MMTMMCKVVEEETFVSSFAGTTSPTSSGHTFGSPLVRKPKAKRVGFQFFVTTPNDVEEGGGSPPLSTASSFVQSRPERTGAEQFLQYRMVQKIIIFPLILYYTLRL